MIRKGIRGEIEVIKGKHAVLILATDGTRGSPSTHVTIEDFGWAAMFLNELLLSTN